MEQVGNGCYSLGKVNGAEYSSSWQCGHCQCVSRPAQHTDPRKAMNLHPEVAVNCGSPGIALALREQQREKAECSPARAINLQPIAVHLLLSFLAPSRAVRSFVLWGCQPLKPSSSFSPWNSSSGPGRTKGEPAFVIKTMRHKYFTLVMRYLALIYSLKPGAIPALLIIMNYCRTWLHLLLVNLAVWLWCAGGFFPGAQPGNVWSNTQPQKEGSALHCCVRALPHLPKPAMGISSVPLPSPAPDTSHCNFAEPKVHIQAEVSSADTTYVGIKNLHYKQSSFKPSEFGLIPFWLLLWAQSIALQHFHFVTCSESARIRIFALKWV